MDYSKLVNDNGVYLYQDDNFNTISMKFYFLANKGNREDAINSIMCQYLEKSNKVYSDLEEKQKELYYMDSSFSLYEEGSITNIVYSIDMISPSKVSCDYLEDAFAFIRDFLLQPDFTNEKLLETIKRTYTKSILYSLSDSSKRASKLYRQSILDEKDHLFVDSVDENYIKSIIDSITLEDIENAYKSIIKEDKFFKGLIFGNVSIEEFKKFREYFTFKSSIESFDYSNPVIIKENDMEVVDPDTNESIVYISYAMNNISEKYSMILSEIFNGGSGLCHEILREKYGLVYSSYMSLYYYRKVLYICAKIDKKNKQKLLDAIDEIMMIACDEEKIKPYLDIAKKSINNSAYLLEEQKEDMIDTLDDHIRGADSGLKLEDFLKEVNNTDEKEISGFVRTLRKKNVFMYRGDKK